MEILFDVVELWGLEPRTSRVRFSSALNDYRRFPIGFVSKNQETETIPL